MYKVFFNDRVIFISADFKNFPLDNSLVYPLSTRLDAEIAWKSFLEDKDNRDMFLLTSDIEKGKKLFWGLFTVIDAAGGIVTNNHQQLLIILRWGKWDLPKGKAEKNEKPEETAIREVEEECGITRLTNTGFNSSTFHIYEHPRKAGRWVLKQTWWFNMTYEGDEKLVPQTNEGIVEACWVKKSELLEALNNTWSSLKPIFEFVINSEPISSHL